MRCLASGPGAVAQHGLALTALVVDSKVTSRLARRLRGVQGEEKVGAILDALTAEGMAAAQPPPKECSRRVVVPL